MYEQITYNSAIYRLDTVTAQWAACIHAGNWNAAGFQWAHVAFNKETKHMILQGGP